MQTMLNNSSVSTVQSKVRLIQSDRVWKEIGSEVLDFVNQAHSLGQSQNGDLTRQLELELAGRYRRKFCITTACATDALDIALQALDLNPGSRIAVPNYTFTATAHAVIRAGHVPVVVDVCDNYCIDSNSIVNVDAVVPVDLFGNMCNHKSLMSLGVPVVVDAAQSLESRDHNGVASPSHGVLSCISFSPSKTISCWGSGGAVLTDDPVLADRCGRLRLHGKKTNSDLAIAPGLNSMMSSAECAAVLVGLKYSAKWQSRRKAIADYIISQSQFVASVDALPQHTLSKLVFQTENRASIIDQLSQLNIETAVHYQRLINDEHIYCSRQNFLNSNRLRSISFTVPNQHTLTDYEVELIAKGLQ
jgi:UDP-2-acetamido-2-deoxy-ribo-hexuluronate aminotransferase